MAVITKRLNWLKWLYPGEGGLLSEQNWHIDKRRNHMKDDHVPGVVSGLEVLETSPTPDLEVHVQVGRAVGGDGEEIVLESVEDVDLSAYASGGATVLIVAEYAEQGTDPYIVPETATSQDRFLQDVPTITAITGAPAANQIVLAQVVISNGATQITDAADPENPGTDEIDLRHRTPNYAIDVRMVPDKSGDANLSTVTVGESGCDFDDLNRALAFVSGLNRSEARQCTIHLFEKRNAQQWNPAEFILPTWTHLIGIGKPFISFTAAVANLIVMNEGSEIRDVEIATNDQWTDTVIDMAGNRCKLKGVTLRYENNSVKAAYMVDVLSGSDNCIIEGLTLLPYTGDEAKSSFGLVINGDYCVVRVCHMSLYQKQLDIAGSYARVSDIDVNATGTWSAVDISGSHCKVTNLTLRGVADRGVAVEAGADDLQMTNCTLESTDTNWTALSTVSVRGQYNNINIPYGQVVLADVARYNQFSNCVFMYAFNGPNPVVTVRDSRNVFAECYIDRGGIAQAGIEAGSSNADDCIVVGCTIVGTNGAASIKGFAGADGWTGAGNNLETIVDPNGGLNWSIGVEWVSGFSLDSTYQAPHDLMVVGWLDAGTASDYVEMRTDASNPPTTVRQAWDPSGISVIGSFSFPVKKGDYWRVADVTGSPAATIYTAALPAANNDA